MENMILGTDSYKVGQWRQTPKNTTNIHSYFESRGGLFPETVFFGLQYVLKKHFCSPITTEMVIEAFDIFAAHFGNPCIMNLMGWDHIIKYHKGYLPLRIKAVPEGSLVPTLNVLVTVENTCPQCYWVTNYMETVLSQIWYSTTVSTVSYNIKKLILGFLNKTGTPGDIDFKLNDFGFRGSTSCESAGIGGCAHLVNFKGTDNLAAIVLARDYYNDKMAGFSIPATEHSTITSWLQENEAEAFRNMIKTYGDNPLYTCVSDSYDVHRACSELWGTELREEVLNAKGTLVIRPDSGVPHQIVPECIEILGDKFGFVYNSKGYKLLNPKVRIIQGDGVSLEEIRKILTILEEQNWSADNLAFGCGGALLQKMDRDTQQFAFKCSSAVVDGQQRDVFKDPVTDRHKRSKHGRMSLILKDGQYKTVPDSDRPNDCLREVYLNGTLLIDESLETIRERVNKNLV